MRVFVATSGPHLIGVGLTREAARVLVDVYNPGLNPDEYAIEEVEVWEGPPEE